MRQRTSELDQMERERDAMDEYRRHSRDQECEPRHGRTAHPGVQRRHPSARVDASSATLICPACRGPVYVPRDSDAERVDCFGCEAKLVTLQGLDGVAIVEQTVEVAHE